MELTSSNVEKIFEDCLFKDGEDTSTAILVDGVLSKFGFHPDRIVSHKGEIGEMLRSLPDDFHLNKGGGMSFMNACVTKDGIQWGEHRNIEQLLVLGIASGQAKILMPRNMWNLFPGGMPYFVVYGE
jgi:hypothetical protein